MDQLAPGSNGNFLESGDFSHRFAFSRILFFVFVSIDCKGHRAISEAMLLRLESFWSISLSTSLSVA